MILTIWEQLNPDEYHEAIHEQFCGLCTIVTKGATVYKVYTKRLTGRN